MKKIFAITIEVEVEVPDFTMTDAEAKDCLDTIKEESVKLAPLIVPAIQFVDAASMMMMNHAVGGPKDPTASKVTCSFSSDVFNESLEEIGTTLFTGERISRPEFDKAVEDAMAGKSDGNTRVLHVEKDGDKLSVHEVKAPPKKGWGKAYEA